MICASENAWFRFRWIQVRYVIEHGGTLKNNENAEKNERSREGISLESGEREGKKDNYDAGINCFGIQWLTWPCFVSLFFH